MYPPSGLPDSGAPCAFSRPMGPSCSWSAVKSVALDRGSRPFGYRLEIALTTTLRAICADICT